MEFDLDQRSASLSVGEFSAFITGPRNSSGGPQGVWRAQLGTHWHNELRGRATAETPATEFEIPITGRVAHRGWLITLTGRIDQLLRSADEITLREIKTVTRELPADEAELRSAYPDYFAQLSAYVELTRLGALDGRQRNGVNPVPTAPGECHVISDIPFESGPEECHVLRDIGPESSTSEHARRQGGAATGRPAIRAELCFVEVDSGLAQTVTLTRGDVGFLKTQLERVVEFLELRHRARERLRHLRFRPAFAKRRPGQETTEAELTATFAQHPLVLFEAPTGFGKTGVLLEFALGQLRSGHFDRVLYLTSKSTGQIQVVRTLAAMTDSPAAAKPAPDRPGRRGDRAPAVPAAAGSEAGEGSTPVAVWHVRNKAEHCVNATFHCVRESCAYLADAATRWPHSGLSRFYIDEHQARDLDTLRAAGREARICPYEITRAALAFNDVWIGDYNYVFAPRNRGLFFEQPGFVAARTLLLLDEAHNLPSRVADAYSHAFSAAAAYQLRDELHRLRPLASLVTAWDHWCHFLDHLRANHGLSAGDEDDARHLLAEVAKLVSTVPIDLAELGPQASDVLWSVPSFVDELAAAELPRLWWCPADRELVVTCLDAAPAIGAALREFGGVVLASATLTPIDGFAAACGLDAIEVPPAAPLTPDSARTADPAAAPPDRLGALNKRDTKKLYRQLTTGAQLLRVEEARDAARPTLLRALTPWRDGAYDVALDARVDTTFQHRSLHYTTTAATIAALHRSAVARLSAGPTSGTDRLARDLPAPMPLPCVAAFFPSYAYAEALKQELADVAPGLRVALQPRVRDLAAQSAWVGESLRSADALFLVLGSSFAESIDALGGRVAHAIVVGPALPEVNPIQRARLAEAARAGLSREEAFRRVYQIPGMTKVNQALGRLVRAPGQRARVILHCRRFLEPSYADLLAPEYQSGTPLTTDDDFSGWLEQVGHP